MNRGALHQICLNFKLFNFLITKEKLERHPRISRKSTAHNKEMKNYQNLFKIAAKVLQKFNFAKNCLSAAARIMAPVLMPQCLIEAEDCLRPLGVREKLNLRNRGWLNSLTFLDTAHF